MPVSDFAANSELLEQVEQEQEVLPVGVYLIGEPVPADRVKLFEVNGRQYTSLKTVDHRIVFRYLKTLRKDSDSAAAMANLMYDALGDAVMDALATEELTPDQFDIVMRVVEKHIMGATNQALGNSSSGRRR